MTPYVAADHRGIVYLVPTSVEPKFFLDDGRAEFVVLERACRVLRDLGRLAEGQTFVDVGAHIGTTSLTAVATHGFARAVAIEPDPAHLPLLRANVALNQLGDRVVVVAGAMSDSRRQEQAFQQGSRKQDRTRWMKGRLVDDGSETSVRVDTLSLDGLVEDGAIDPDATGLLWFDCAGCEGRALQTATTFLERGVPLVITVRRNQFAEPTPLLERLQTTYDRAIDLRSPRLADPVSTWSPTVRPVEDLAVLPEDKKLTDVLVY
jgi:FkbM family methyltransferase